MKGEKGRQSSRRREIKRGKLGRRRGSNSTRTETKYLVPLSQRASSMRTHLTTYMKNSDICGQISLLIILSNPDYFVFYL